MPEPIHGPRPVRARRKVSFGVFEVDLDSGELRRLGLRIKLQDKPFQVLATLLERPGEVVSRDELRAGLWPDHTFVDFEHSLNIAMAKLRVALGESAQSPRFIETLPKRGYRFVAPVVMPQAAAEPTVPKAVPAPSLEQPHHRHALALAMVGLVLVGIVAFVLRPPLPPPRITRTTRLTRTRRGFSTLVTDGSRLYLSGEIEGHSVLEQMSTAGGETVPVPTAFSNNVVLDVSPNGSELLLQSYLSAREEERPLWILPMPAESPRRVGDVLANEGAAAWTPDGRHIVFGKGTELWVVNEDGGGARKVATASGAVRCPHESPDEKLFRFWVYDSKTGSSSLWEVRSDGSGLRPVLPGWENPSDRRLIYWTPDGKYFLFESGGAIWVRREKGSFFRKVSREPVRLTSGLVAVGSFVPSKDWKQLFVIPEQEPLVEVLRYDARSGQFALYRGGMAAGHLDFPRNGLWIAYIAYPEMTLWRSKVDGTEELQLTFSHMVAALPRWSPDAKRIAFMATAPGRSSKIYVVPAEGGSPQMMVPGEGPEGAPTWSPDGNSLVFGDNPLDSGPSPNMKIHLYDLKTHQTSTLPGSQGLWTARYSPDGRYVVAVRWDQQKLMLFDVTAQKWMELANVAVGDNPSWSHDGKYVYFDSPFGSDPAIYRVRVSNRKLERVAGLKNVRRTVGLLGYWIGLTPDDSPLIVGEANFTNVYAVDWVAP